MLEPLERDRTVEVLRDALVRRPVRIAPHVTAERRAIGPAADHDELFGIFVGSPNLEVDKTIERVNEVNAVSKSANQLVGAFWRYAQS